MPEQFWAQQTLKHVVVKGFSGASYVPKGENSVNYMYSGKPFICVALLESANQNYPYKMGVGICIQGQFAYDCVQQKQI